jgi:aryl-alcohol dehydrogenase-like predicted oxidoreductase
MREKELGRTGIRVASIGMGCMGIGGGLERSTSCDAEHIRALEAAIDSGMTFLDTAEVYGQGHSEELIGKAIRGRRRDRVVIASKVSPEHLGYRDVIAAAEASMKRLRVDHLDLYQVHWPNPSIPVGETMDAMEVLKSAGKIRHAGVSNFSAREIEEVRTHPRADIVSVQVEYNLFDRSAEDALLPYCEEEGITIIAYSPLDQGRIAGNPEKLAMLRSVANKYGKSIAQVALNWLVRHPPVVAIPKSTRLDHIRENAEAVDFDLAVEDFEAISRLFSRECVKVATDRICVVENGQGNRAVYRTVDDAIENKLGFVPSPVELARNIRGGEVLKPVRVVPTKDRSGRYEYDLVEGRVRYWAWVIAHEGKEPIDVYIRG